MVSMAGRRAVRCALLVAFVVAFAVCATDDADLVFEEEDSTQSPDNGGGSVSPVASPPQLQEEGRTGKSGTSRRSVGQEHVLPGSELEDVLGHDDEDYNDDGSGSGERTVVYRATLNVTSIQYETGLGDRTNSRFQHLSHELSESVQQLFDTIPGQQTVTVIMFEPTTRGVMATLDLSSLGYNERHELRNVFARALDRRRVGNFPLAPEGFTFRPMKDEDDCKEFKCPESRECILHSQYCDGVQNCRDNRDEADCVFCDRDQFECEDGLCIDERSRCDGIPDCRHGEDESGCPSKPQISTTELPPTQRPDCPHGQFACSDGVCIDNRRRCDFVVDCSKGEDESFCPPCLADQWRCSEGSCIQASSWCDGHVDCPDISDEEHCLSPPQVVCSPGQFRCDNGSCISVLQRCDGFPHCPDYSGADERDCPCTTFEWQCDDGRCISKSLLCNGRTDCPADNSDERDCPSPAPTSACSAYQFQCQDGTCIESHNQCNGRIECPDGSDERNCHFCQQGYFHCTDNTCIEEHRRCDGRVDCNDRSDEFQCDCHQNEFRCKDGTCVPARQQCDGHDDCPDGSDEEQCFPIHTCGHNEFRCTDGTCISENNRCNEYADCPDHSDERDCVECKPDYMSCNDGTCIDVRRRCDGHPDCHDRSDEQSCPQEMPTCSPQDVVCGDGTCVPESSMCDGRLDCIDGVDEANCIPCSDQEFRCGDGRCIESWRRCDNHPDCSDRSDEHECGCKANQFECRDGSCIEEYRKCDGHSDCRDHSDEDGCPVRCQHYEFKCGDGSCIDDRRKCDGRQDCRDNSDEHDCPSPVPEPACPPGYKACKSGHCLHSTVFCDKRPDCPDRSDEDDCDEPETQSCLPGQFRCTNGQCIDQSKKCDDKYDCPDLSDELDCPREVCQPGQFACSDDTCVEGTAKCDGKADCSDHSDEANCPLPPVRGSVNLKTYPDYQTIHQSREVVFQCRDEGQQRAPVRWSREGNQQMPHGFTDVHGRLTMPNIQLEHSGTYFCTAVGAGSGGPPQLGEQRSVYLRVEPYERPTTLRPGVCGAGETACKNGQCIQQAFVCDEDLDCTDGSDEENCPIAGVDCEPNEFQCKNRKCILKLWLCDGDDDCMDKSDEVNCVTNPPGSQCRYDEYKCESGNQCIPKSFQCDAEVDCQDRSDEIGCSPPTVVQLPPATKTVQVGETVVLSCRAIGNPTPLINWRLNWGHIPPPPRVTVTSENGVGTLTIRNVQVTDQGAYTCEAINNKQSVLGVPDTVLVVISASVCQPPLFNSAARSHSECLRCFCFGASDQCVSSNLFVSQLPPLTEIGISPVSLDPDGSYNLGDPTYSLNQDSIDFRQNTREFRLDNRVQRGQPPSLQYYWTLPQSYKGNLLNSYGGFLRYTVLYRISGSPSGTSSPDIIMKGNGITISHAQTDSLRPGVSNPVEVQMWEGSWTLLGSGRQPPASREDIAMVLQNVEVFLVRAAYDNNFVESSLVGVSLDTAVPQSTGQPASYVEQCSCPPGYTGNSCESCASGYSRVQSGRFLGECRRGVCNCNGHSTSCDAQGTCERCQHNTEGDRCERCRPGFYGDARRGSPNDCQSCPCPLTQPSNQFASTCHLDRDGQVTCDDCQPGYEGRRCERCAPGYSGNPLLPRDSCRRQVEPQCHAYGSTSPTPNPVTGLCPCKPFVTGAQCSNCRESSFYLNPSSPDGCISCFCMGVTRNCTSCDLFRSEQAAQFSGNDAQGFTLAALGERTSVERGLQVNTNQELVFREFYFLPRGKTHYWRLPEDFTGDKLTAYGGYLNYTIRFSSPTGSPPNMDPHVQITGNHITLDHFPQQQLVPNRQNTISVPFFEQYWRRSDGQTTTREHLMMALADLDSFHIKATYTEDTSEVAISEVILETAEENPRRGGQRAQEVEKCSCPPGYKGLSCEDCDVGFKRTGGGLYLGLCESCFCNGHSSDCDSQTGVCRNCQHNTEGDYCEACKPGYVGDATRGSPRDCLPPTNGGPCQCSAEGSFSQDCDSRGNCRCKTNAEGPQCDHCKEGYYNLDSRNPDGCTQCFCSGITTQCSSSSYYRSQARVIVTDADSHGVILTSRDGRQTVDDGLDANPSRNEISYRAFPPAESNEEILFWALPSQFLGNKLSSYGGSLKFTQRYHARRQGRTLNYADVIITGNGISLTHTSRSPLRPQDSRPNNVDLTEAQWLEDERQTPVSRDHFMRVLSNLDSILIRATYNEHTIDSVLGDVSMDTAVPHSTGQELAYAVEQCSCPPGYTGLSCENCASGYDRDVRSNRCIRCNCHGHSDSCDPNTGLCSRCEHNTEGLSCERCVRGYYGDATRGTHEDCQPCPCPLTEQSNRFSPTCRLDSDGRPTCTACPAGYIGRNCEQCEQGYRGDPRQIGGSCQPDDGPSISVRIDEPRVVRIDEGNTVTFRCSAISSGSFNIVWTKEGSPLPSHSYDRDGTLTIHNVRHEDSGTYVCTARDSQGQSQDRATLLVASSSVIPSPPKVWIEPRFIEAQVGESIEFRCLSEGYPTPTLQWSGPPGSELSSASSFRDGVFKIPSVRKSDQSEYFCTATSASGTESVRTILYVIGDEEPHPPPPPPPPETDRVLISPSSHTVRSGERAEFDCSVDPAHRAGARISWERQDGSPLPSVASQSRGVLTFSSVDQSCSGIYICTAVTTFGTFHGQAQLTIISGGGGGRPSVQIEPEHQTASSGATVELRCIVHGDHYGAVRWSKLREELPRNHQVTGSTLRIVNVDVSDRGIYICEVDSHEGIVKASTVLEVNRRAVPAVEIYPGTIQEVERGHGVIFQCRVVSGLPIPKVQWTRADGRPLPRNAEVLSGGAIIRFNNVAGEEAGQYVCTAENEAGMITATVTLTIRGLPVARISPASPYTVAAGQRVHLECRGEGDPIPSVHWRQPHTQRGVPESLPLETPGLSILEIAQVRSEDAGTYTCTVRNSHGSSENALQLIVDNQFTNPGISTDQRKFIVPEGSRAEMTCYVIGSDAAGLTLSWLRSDSKPLPVGHTIRNGLLTIESVRKEDAGVYTCMGIEHGTVIFTADEELIVVTPPRITLNPLRQSARPGDSVYIQCHAEGDQPISIEWSRVGGTLGYNTYSRDGHLQFDRIAFADAGRYLCSASNAAGKAEAVAEVVVNDVVDCGEDGRHCEIPSSDCFGSAYPCTEEPAIHIPNREMSVFIGASAELLCEVRGAPVPSVTWQKENGELPYNSRIVDTNLRISNVHIEDAGRYFCMATNDAGSSRDYVNLQVKGLSPLTVRIEPSLETVRLGDSLDVHCEVTGDPSARITWTRVSGNMPQNAQTAGNLLRITNVLPENGGIYQCEVNTYTGTFTEEYVLSILAIPSLPHRREVATRPAPFGTTVVMDCRTNFNHPIDYVWSRQGGLLPADSSVQGPVLTIPDVRAEDAGTYVCTASNGGEKINVPTILVITGVIPYFAQAPNSFMALPTLPKAYVKFDVEISFKPENPDGLIMYNGQESGGGGDFISFGLTGGHAEFRFDLGSGLALLRSLEPVTMGEWHTALISRETRDGMLIVDKQHPVNGTAAGRFRGLDLDEPLYFGGVPNYQNIHKLAGFKRGFVGCISRVIIGNTTHQLVRDAQITSGVTNCDTCTTNPCRNGGVCQEAHTENGHTCICAPGFSGSTCEDAGGTCYPGVCGTGRCINRLETGYDCYCPFGKAGEHCERDITIHEPAFSDDAFVAYPTPNARALRHLKISARIKPRELKDGIIVYCGQSENGQGDFISIALKNRRLEFRFDTGSGPAVLQSREEVQADEWTVVNAERNFREGSLVVNDGEEVKGKSQGHTRGLNLHLPLYVGGVDKHKISVNPLVEVNRGFDGCISHMEVSGVEVDLINSVVDAANVEDCGGQMPCDRRPCVNGGTCRDLGPQPLDYQCSCLPGFRGTNCQVEDDLCQQIQPCLNGGTCVGTGTSYKCNCPHYYGGVNCGDKVQFSTKVRFQGDGYLELPRDLLPHTSSTVAEVITLQFETSKPNGLVFWHGQKPEVDGKGQDFISLSVVEGYLEFSFALGNGPALIRSPVRVDDGSEHKVVLRRLALDGSLQLDDVFTEYGETEGVLQMLDTAGNIFLGGVPNHLLMTAGRYNQSFSGCISNVQFQENDPMDLQSRAVSGINVAHCDSDNSDHPYDHSNNRIE